MKIYAILEPSKPDWTERKVGIVSLIGEMNNDPEERHDMLNIVRRGNV